MAGYVTNANMRDLEIIFMKYSSFVFFVNIVEDIYEFINARTNR